jgi:hypothetical protein
MSRIQSIVLNPLAALLTITATFGGLALTAVAASPSATPRVPEAEALPKGAKVVALDVQPATVQLSGRYDAVQLLVTARLDSGDTVDATRLATLKLSSMVADVLAGGRLTAAKNGTATLTVSLAGKSARVPVSVRGISAVTKVDFIRDVNPVLSKLGCNQGTCHGSKEGKGGFKLSLRGYDPLYDVRALADDLAGRRVNFASPDDSLMLLKATAAVPHEGGQRTRVGEPYYEILRAWIADGAKVSLATPRVTRIEVFPKDPVVQHIGARQQVRVVATYADGRQRDVTAEAFIESGNTDVVTTDGGGLMNTLRRGEAPVLARYEGAYAATTVTVMGDRSGFTWQEPETWTRVDELVAAKWKRMKILPSPLCSDEEFLRRVHLDLTGLPPTAAEVLQFLADRRDTRVKRDEVVNRLVGSNDYVDHWANKWADLLQVNRKFLGEEGAALFRDWIRAEVANNTPYDQFVKKVLTATGSNRENPAASYWKILRTPAEAMENTTHLFLATRFNCNKCHDHPFERWTQDQYYHLAQYFAQVDFQRDPASGNRNIGGTAVEGAKPLFEIVLDKTEGGVPHDRTGQLVPPDFPYPAKFQAGTEKPSRRQELAHWLASPDNRYFALSYVNRLWGYLMGVGLIEPLDDIRAGNPPTNPELLQHLTQEFINSGFNVQHVIKLICKSRVYQLSLATHEWNHDDKINYSHATARRLPAEVLYDAVLKVTGSTPNFPGVKPGTRAAQLPDSAIDVPSGLLANLGRPPRESACECERSNDIKLSSVMALLSGPAVSGAINDPKNELAKLTASITDDRRLIDEIFLRVLGRHATEREIKATLQTWSQLEAEHTALQAELAAREQWWLPVYARKQREREQAIAAARAAVAAREAEIAPARAEAEKKRLDEIAKQERALAAHEKGVAARQIEWEQKVGAQQLATAWLPVTIKDAKSTGGLTLKLQPDGSVIASGPDANNPVYTITAETDLENITGVMIEALPDNSLPKFGPGRAKDGNFVLTELELSAGGGRPARRGAAAPAGAVSVAFKDARADFSQTNFEVKTAINGMLESGQRDGWAVSPKFGEPHFARFSLAKPLAGGKGTQLTFTLRQNFRENYSIGRFRLWVTASQTPLEQGLPAAVIAALQTPSAERTDAQAKVLSDYYRGTVDVAGLKRQQALHTAKLPVPEDPKLVELREALAKAELPVPLDPKLVQLRADAELSAKQLANKRLTGVQDLAWALINTPAFLFNR